MNFSELELEDYIYKNPHVLGMREWIGRQIKLPMGRLDLFGVHEQGMLFVVELKVIGFNYSNIAQLNRYARALEDIAANNCYAPPRINKMLVTQMSNISAVDLYDIEASDVYLLTYKATIGEIKFEHWGYTRDWKRQYDDRCNVMSDFVKKYLALIYDNQPDWFKEGRTPE